MITQSSFVFSCVVCSVLLAGCALVTEPLQNAVEESRVVPVGTRIAGNGFSIRAPSAGLFVVRDSPRRGYLSLRATTREMFAGSGSYNVYPFTVKIPKATLRDAWIAYADVEFSPSLRPSYRILSERSGMWRQQPAWFHVGYGRQSPAGGGFIAATCVVQRGSSYYAVIRSLAVYDSRTDTLSRTVRRAEHELELFLDGVTFDLSTT